MIMVVFYTMEDINYVKQTKTRFIPNLRYKKVRNILICYILSDLESYILVHGTIRQLNT